MSKKYLLILKIHPVPCCVEFTAKGENEEPHCHSTCAMSQTQQSLCIFCIIARFLYAFTRCHSSCEDASPANNLPLWNLCVNSNCLDKNSPHIFLTFPVFYVEHSSKSCFCKPKTKADIKQMGVWKWHTLNCLSCRDNRQLSLVINRTSYVWFAVNSANDLHCVYLTIVKNLCKMATSLKEGWIFPRLWTSACWSSVGTFDQEQNKRQATSKEELRKSIQKAGDLSLNTT